ncbi:MAG: SDR family oxidoreductase [Novosphingobium sp.]|nr:SDR family oxidoreductase [Novosphingobium sp.]
MVEMEGKVALITGAGQGIGHGVARAMAQAGAQVMLAGRTYDKVAQAAQTIVAEGGEAQALACDVCNAEQIDAAVEATCAAFGGIDVLVNNAQQVPLGKLDDVTDEAFIAGFESGPLATFRLMKRVQPVMAARGGGTIFNFASSAGIRWDMTGYGAYAAVKQATRALTRAAAAEWGRAGVRVLTIAPHGESPGLKGWIEHNPAEAEAFFRTIPLGRIGRLEEDIGRALVALSGTDLGYLTGTTIPLDGGQANFD